MPQNRRVRRGSSRKYLFRRTVLVLLMFALGGFALYTIWPDSTNEDAEPKEPSQSASDPEPQVSQVSASESQSEPESEPEEDESSQSEEESSESESEPEEEEQPEASEEASQPVSEPTGDWSILLVNTDNPLPENYQVPLETIVDHYQVDQRIADNVRRMFNHAKEDGINLMICSAYRAPSRQEELFEAKKQEFIQYGYDEESAIAATSSWIAFPGTSEHHTGLALDIVTPAYQTLDEGFAETAAFRWLTEHAAEYGFVLRYPKDKVDITKISYEPWHYRYVGEWHARQIWDAGYCLEEYISVVTRNRAEQLQSQLDAEAAEGENEEGEPAEEAQ